MDIVADPDVLIAGETKLGVLGRCGGKDTGRESGKVECPLVGQEVDDLINIVGC